MAQGQFTKQEASSVKETVNDLFNAIPKSKRFDYLGHLNDILLFIDAAAKAAPDEGSKEGA